MRIFGWNQARTSPEASACCNAERSNTWPDTSDSAFSREAAFNLATSAMMACGWAGLDN